MLARDGTELPKLRAMMKERGVDAFVAFSTDDFGSNFVQPAHKFIYALTGFTGSTAYLIVTADKAVLLVDGRYTLQAENETSGLVIEDYYRVYIDDYLVQNMPKGSSIAVDRRYCPTDDFKKIETAARVMEGRITALPDSILEECWALRPPISLGAPFPIDEKWFRPTEEKLRIMQARMRDLKVDSAVLGEPDSCAWLTNVRAFDQTFQPSARSCMILTTDRSIVFLDAARISAVRAACRNADLFEWRRFEEYAATLREVSGKLTAISRFAPLWLFGDERPDQFLLLDREFGIELRARKSDAEVSGMRRAQVEDAAALLEFYADLASTSLDGLSEMDISERLLSFRSKRDGFLNPSFEPIVGLDANSAVVHYHPESTHARRASKSGVLLIDSGSHYKFGTTDITRTLQFGKHTQAFSRAYSLVAKAHLAMRNAVFETGARGWQIDTFARGHIWREGLDYEHGTGHGVGQLASIHELPYRVTKYLGQEQFYPNMIVSNEPGLYFTGEFGIRIENEIVIVKKTDRQCAVENITHMPVFPWSFDRAVLSGAEIDQFLRDNAAGVDAVRPMLSPKAQTFADACLDVKTSPFS